MVSRRAETLRQTPMNPYREDEKAMKTSVFGLLLSIVITMSLCTATYAADIRRVVTVLDEHDKAVVLFDSRLPLTDSGVVSRAELWSTDTLPPGFSREDSATKSTGISPPDGGTAFRVIDFPPRDEAAIAKLDPNFLMKQVGDHAPIRGQPTKDPLMHRTRTVDYVYIISGEIDMMLDDSTVHLQAGDVVIQQATNHAWINRGSQPCRVLFVLMDSKQP